MDEYVKREAVKEWLRRWEGYIDMDIIARMQYRVIDIPAIDVRENVRGKWVRITNCLAKCSACEDYIDNAISCGYNYCPNCGAEMSV